MTTDKLPRAKEMTREPHNIVLEVSHPARRLVLESRNVWSPSRGVPPVLRGFQTPAKFTPGFPELPTYTPIAEPRAKIPLGGVIQRVNNSQLDGVEEKKGAFSQVLMGAVDKEDARRAVLRSRVGRGFSPERVVKVLRELNVIKEQPRRPAVQSPVPLQGSQLGKEEFSQSVGPGFRDVQHFYPESFHGAKASSSWAATESLAQAYGKRSNAYVSMQDAVPRRVPGSEFSMRQTGASGSSPMRQPQFIRAHQAKTNTINPAAQRLEEVNKRNTDAAGLAFKVAGFLYEGQQNLHKQVADDLEDIVFRAFQQDIQPEKDDVSVRAVGILVEQNAVGKLKSYVMRLMTSCDLLRSNQTEFQTAFRMIATLLYTAPQVRDAFLLNGFMDQLVQQVASLLTHTEFFLRNAPYFHSIDFFLCVGVISRLYYPATKALLPALAGLLKFLIQQFIQELQKPIEEVKKFRRQYQDDVLDEASYEEEEDLPNYITPEIKGALLNQLIKASRAESAMEIMLSKRHEQRLIRQRHGKQARVFSDLDCFVWAAICAQQTAFAWLQQAYADGNREGMLQLTGLLQGIVESLQAFENVCSTYREKHVEQNLHQKQNTFQSFVYAKLQSLSDTGQYVGGEILTDVDYSTYGDGLTQQIRQQLQALL